ncbi:MAG: S-layer y protein [Oscillospiraceae bacterium]|nr:S-layer y protein [Oscillospiraceae bacterium]
MRNLKKVLSLVMALAMSLSLANVALAAPVASTTTKASTSTSTTFTDESSIENIDAVSLLATLGILSGYEDGTFLPAQAVTRAEAAKIVCYLLLGEDAASALSDAAVTTGFTDVDGQGYDWATGFIQYAATNGIISGYGDSKFGPADTVTTYQLAKMILCGLGYGVNGEYTGSYWATNVAVQAVKSGVLEKGATNVACTRDDTALIAYNSLFAYLVSWSSDDNKYNYITEENDAGDDVKQTLAIQNYDYQTAKGVLGYDSDDGYYIDVVNTDDVDEDKVYVDCTDPTLFGQNVEAGVIDDQGVTNVTAIDKTLGTTTKGNYSDWINDDEDDYIADLNSDDSINSGKVILYYNGEKVGSFTEAQLDTKADNGYFTDGMVTTLVDQGQYDADDDKYTFDGDIDLIIIVDKYVSQVGEDEVTVDDDEVTIDGVDAKTADGSDSLTEIDSDKIVYPSDLSDGDIVLSYQDAASEIYYVEKAASVTGSIDSISYKSSKYHYTIDSTKYGESGLNTSNSGLDDTNLNGDGGSLAVGDDVIFYLDNNSDIVYADGDASGSDDYAAIVKAKWVDSSSADAYLSLKLLFSDGTTDVVEIDQLNGDDADDALLDLNGDADTYTDDDDRTTAIEGYASDLLTDKTIVTYSENSDGTYDVDTVDDADDISATTSSTGIVNGTAKININGSYYADSSTVFFLYDGDDYSAYTGIKNVSDVDSISYVYAVVDGTSLEYVYAEGDVSGVSADNYFFLLDTEYTDHDDYYSYPAAMDGNEDTSVNTDSKISSATAGYVYSVDEENSDGYATEVSKQSWTAGIALVSSGTLVIGDDEDSDDNDYSYDSSTVVYRITYNATKDKYEASVGKVSSYVKEGTDDLIYVVPEDEDDDTPYATEIFVLEDCAPTLSLSFSDGTDDTDTYYTDGDAISVDGLTAESSQVVTLNIPDGTDVDVDSIVATDYDSDTENGTAPSFVVKSSSANTYTLYLESGDSVSFDATVSTGNGIEATYTVTLTAS